jgi:hypothetical protein
VIADGLIFVQIASYRDRELPLTIEAALRTAEMPERLRFGICWQYDEESALDLEPWVGDPRFRIDEVYYRQSRGCCWARSRINSLYDGEEFTLQIDAHTRFAENWDRRFIEMLAVTSNPKPLLTTYPPSYTTAADGSVELNTAVGVQRLMLEHLRPNLGAQQKCEMAPDLSRPGKSPLIAAGLVFTLGRFCVDVPYDPELYFGGEEIALAARAYTHGYDFFYPNENLVWHLYDHPHPLHWEDRNAKRFDTAEEERLKTLLLGDSTTLGPYGLGTERSLEEFETYAGLQFAESVR